MLKRKAGFMKAIGREIVVSGRKGVALARALTGAGFLFDAGCRRLATNPVRRLLLGDGLSLSNPFPRANPMN